MARPKARQSSLYFDYPDYPFIRPPELEGKTGQYPVIIVGAGPVGVTAALELARHGIKSIVLDDKATVNEGSRAICIARHSMECLQQLGLAEKFEAKALPWTHGTSYYRDKEVYRLQMPHSSAERYYPMYNLQQQYIEKYLIDKAEADPLIELRWQSKVTDVSQDDNGARLGIETPAGSYSLNSDYVLAADGARSVVRHKLGLHLKGDAYEGRYVIVDIQMEADYPTERRAFFDPSSNPGLTILVHKQPDNIWRIDYQISADVDEEEELKEDNIRERISSVLEMIGETAPWQLEWWSLYKAYTLALDDYREGRILFIGDAAHLVPIFGVRGLNSGLADAMNAAWKLAYVIRGHADEALLDSYSPERRGATLDVFENASKSTKFMTPPTRGHRLMRDAVLSLSISNDFPRPLINPRQSQPYTYVDSPLTSYRNRDAEFNSGPSAGAPIINRRIGDRDSLLDYIGPGFSGFYFNDSDSIDPLVKGLPGKLQVGDERLALIIITRGSLILKDMLVLQDKSGEIFSTYDAKDSSFYLIRPDRHISARWKKIKIDEVIQAFTQTLNGGIK
jgi:3-(3-hydroxy-phenyl)propionate hydroxylase